MSAQTDHAESQSYRASGFANRLGWGSRPALIIIDVCAAYFTPGSPLNLSSNPEAAKSPDAMRDLLAAAREGGCPVYWTQVQYEREDMADAGLFYLKAKVLDVWKKGDTRGYDALLPGLEPREGETVIVKKHPSAFFGTDLASQLYFKQVDTVVICGVSTSGCVRATTLDAQCWNFRPMVVGDACGDRTKEIHNGNLFDMDAKMGDVVGVEETCEKMRKGW
ncbi:hypothetical protein M409DRAFT_18531 [Zasmidium cellare ATCC 36951]|uniref:Isochorismatase-like domain-containing protein n=1 Tax=Zasmidium cellare ATCC 36951 TaxID=1080233 RepID=A0A6A6CWL2_ZASCE|nr:uncharacterized protein M409DRAFT_18531 [Zasmidium cellare ATCC 36951]KAF2171415.1 hypothetical protein M409DRAFT_18531 [Zasmidium cellare ATCC 36951]